MKILKVLYNYWKAKKRILSPTFPFFHSLRITKCIFWRGLSSKFSVLTNTVLYFLYIYVWFSQNLLKVLSFWSSLEKKSFNVLLSPTSHPSLLCLSTGNYFSGLFLMVFNYKYWNIYWNLKKKLWDQEILYLWSVQNRKWTQIKSIPAKSFPVIIETYQTLPHLQKRCAHSRFFQI